MSVMPIVRVLPDIAAALTDNAMLFESKEQIYEQKGVGTNCFATS